MLTCCIEHFHLTQLNYLNIVNLVRKISMHQVNTKLSFDLLNPLQCSSNTAPNQVCVESVNLTEENTNHPMVT